MDVESVFAGSESLDFGGDLDFLALRLNELNDAGDAGSTVGVHDANGVVNIRDHWIS